MPALSCSVGKLITSSLIAKFKAFITASLIPLLEYVAPVTASILCTSSALVASFPVKASFSPLKAVCSIFLFIVAYVPLKLSPVTVIPLILPSFTSTVAFMSYSPNCEIWAVPV